MIILVDFTKLILKKIVWEENASKHRIWKMFLKFMSSLYVHFAL